MPGIYATPGLPERACVSDPDFATDVLQDCEKAPDFSMLLLNKKGSKPCIGSALISTSNMLDFKFEDQRLKRFMARLFLLSASSQQN